MLRVGHGKPQIYESENRWGQLSGRYYVNDHMWLCPCEWRKMDAYQAPFEENVPSWLPLEAREKICLNRLAMSPAKQTVWEFDALARNKKDWMRNVIFFGRPSLVQWTWWEANVKWRALKVKAWFLNKLRKHSDE